MILVVVVFHVSLGDDHPFSFVSMSKAVELTVPTGTHVTLAVRAHQEADGIRGCWMPWF